MANAFLCHMNILLGDGSTAESTRATGKPVRLNIGDNSLSSAFEAELAALKQGDTHSFTLAAADAFGEHNPDAIHHMERSRFDGDIDLKPGIIVNFTNPAGVDIPGIIREIAGDSVTVDLNHPLAGHQITFELEVMQAW